MKNKNPYWFAVLLNLVTCIAVIWWSIWDMSFGLSILYIAEKHTMAMLDIGISSLGLMWGRLERNKSCTIYNRFVYRTRKR